MTKHYDVVVVGGGMVGSVLAIALSQHPKLSIAVIEHQAPSPLDTNDAPDLRVSALTQASEALLKNLGVWQLLMPERIGPFTDMHVWETAKSTIHFDSADIGEARLGHIVENRNIQQAALQRCQQINTIDVICPASPTELSEHTLSLDNGQSLSADLIVGADGAQSQLRDWLGIELTGWDYEQSGVVCTVTTEKPHQATAWQRFLPDGPLAFLPLADPHQCSIVWSNSTEEAELITALDDDAFKAVLANAFDHTLGDIIDVSARAAFPLKLRHADHYVEDGFALVGDAAHTIHPLAGQGVNIGLLDAATLAEIVIEAKHKHRQIGSLHTLKKYQRRRKGDNLAMQFTMDAFKRLFGSDATAIRWARRIGLNKVNQSQILKDLIMHNASGHRFANPDISKPSI